MRNGITNIHNAKLPITFNFYFNWLFSFVGLFLSISGCEKLITVFIVCCTWNEIVFCVGMQTKANLLYTCGKLCKLLLLVVAMSVRMSFLVFTFFFFFWIVMKSKSIYDYGYGINIEISLVHFILNSFDTVFCLCFFIQRMFLILVAFVKWLWKKIKLEEYGPLSFYIVKRNRLFIYWLNSIID